MKELTKDLEVILKALLPGKPDGEIKGYDLRFNSYEAATEIRFLNDDLALYHEAECDEETGVITLKKKGLKYEIKLDNLPIIYARACIFLAEDKKVDEGYKKGETIPSRQRGGAPVQGYPAPWPAQQRRFKREDTQLNVIRRTDTWRE